MDPTQHLHSLLHTSFILRYESRHRVSDACRVCSCSSVDRSTRRNWRSSGCSPGRCSKQELSRASVAGTPPAGVTAWTARLREDNASLSCCDGSGTRNAARHGSPAFALAKRVSIHSGACASASATACAHPVRMVSSPTSSTGGASFSSGKFDDPCRALAARTWCTATSK